MLRHFLFTLVTATTFGMILSVSHAYAGAPAFKDLPPSHWAYDSVSRLASKGLLKGYENGTFKGNKTLTRYELAMAIKEIVENRESASVASPEFEVLKKLTAEFSSELSLMGLRVDDAHAELSKLKTDVAGIRNSESNGRICLTGDFSFYFSNLEHKVDTRDDDNWYSTATLGTNFSISIDERIKGFIRFLADNAELKTLGISDTTIDEAYVDARELFGLGDLRFGRQWMKLGHGIVLSDKLDGIRFSRVLDKVEFNLFSFSTADTNAAFSRYYGNSAGTSNFYMYSDEHYIVPGKGGNPASYLINGPGITNGSSFTSFSAGNRITLHNTPYAFPSPQDAVSGHSSGTNPDWTRNHHAGIALAQSAVLRPVDDQLPTNIAFTDVVNNLTGAAGADGLYDVDTAGTVTQTPAALSRNWQNQASSGLDSWGFDVSVDFGGHALAAYYLHRDFDRFDPYTSLGDPWAAMVDMNGDLALDVDHLGNAVSPVADPTYWGITLDGRIIENLDYYFEFVNFDPDISNIGADPLTGLAKSGGTRWKGNNLDDGSAWLLGLDWSITKDLSLLVQYGSGDEEFVPASLFKSEYCNGMAGRWNADLSGLTTFADARTGESTGALTGLKDLLIKFSAELNDRTSGYIKYEAARDNDSSSARLVSGNPEITGHPRQDYELVTLKFTHIYKPNTILGLRYDAMKYDDPTVNSAHATNQEQHLSDDVDGGGWQRVSCDLQVKF